MNQYKDLNLKIDITNKKKRVESTDSLFFSYDINAIRVITDITKNGEVLPENTKVFLVVQSAHSMNYEATDSIKIKLDTTISDGKATFELPNEILAYRGFVRLDFYVDFEEGSNDSGQAYVFELRKSQIDQAFDQVEFVYISDFELSKQRVLEAEKQALETIEGVGDQLDATIEETRQTIVKRPQELDTDIMQAQSNIADKVATVDVSKTQAQTTISEYVASVEQSKTTAETNISNNVKNVSDKQTEALNSIDTSVSDVQTKQAQVNDNFTKAIQDVEQAKTTAQSEIASQTDLSADVATAKESMSESVVDVQNTADYEKAQIEAIRPKLESDIAFVKENAESIKAKGFLETPKIAWANSRDMLTDFTTVYPNKNLLHPIEYYIGFKNNIKSSETFMGKIVLETDRNAILGTNYDTLNFLLDEKTDKANYTISFWAKSDTPNLIISNYFYSPNTTTYSENSNGFKSNAVDGNSIISLTTDWQKYWITWTQTDPKEFKNIILGRVPKTKGGKVFIALPKFEEGKTATPHTENPKYDIENSFMKYTATSNINTTDPTKFTQGRYTDEYIDYKLQQLSNTTFATGGTV